jgi:hypothetical protein
MSKHKIYKFTFKNLSYNSFYPVYLHVRELLLLTMSLRFSNFNLR